MLLVFILNQHWLACIPTQLAVGVFDFPAKK
jgi:hypothetical protein